MAPVTTKIPSPVKPPVKLPSPVGRPNPPKLAQAPAAPAPVGVPVPSITFGPEFNAAPPPSAGLYIQPGNHLLKILKIKPILSIKLGQRKTAIVIETQVVESDTMEAGSFASAYMDTAFQGFMSDFKGVLAACANCDPLELKDEHASASLFDPNVHLSAEDAPFYGTLVKVIAWHKDTRNAGKFTKMQWIAVPTEDESAAPGEASE